MANSLQDLISQIEQGMTKSASEDSKDKDEKKDDKDSKSDGKGENPFAKKDDKEDKEDKSDDEKSDDDSDEEDGQTKSASELGAEAARQVMEKVANMQFPQTQSQAAGKTLADALLEKMANAGDVTTPNGATPGADLNKVQRDVVQAEAEHSQNVRPMPTSDGNGPTGTVNEIFDALVADALAQGAASTDQVHERGVAAQVGSALSGVPNQIPTQEKTAAVTQLVSEGMDYEQAVELVKQASAQMEDELEKIAAVEALVAEGIDYDNAVDLVKQAAEELAFEEAAIVKAAALEELVTEHGIDFDTAVEMIKQANAGDVTTPNGATPGADLNKVQRDVVQAEAEHSQNVRPMPTSDGNGPTGTVNEIFDALVADALAQGAASTDQVHERGVAAQEGADLGAVPNQVKTATLRNLVAEGVDFELATQIVKEAAAGAAFKDMAMAAGGLGKAVGNLGVRAAKKGGAAAVKAVTPSSEFQGMVGEAGNLAKAVGNLGGRAAKKVGGAVASKGREAAGAASALMNPGQHAASGMSTGTVRAEAAKSLARNPLVLGGAATATGAGVLAARHKKQASMLEATQMLVAQGVDFTKAAELVQAKADELFGE